MTTKQTIKALCAKLDDLVTRAENMKPESKTRAKLMHQAEITRRQIAELEK